LDKIYSREIVIRVTKKAQGLMKNPRKK